MQPRIALVALALSAACGPARRPLELANGHPEGHPLRAGQDVFLRETWGTEVLGDWPPVDFVLALMEDEPEVFGDQLARFGLVPDPGDDLPVGLKRGSADPTRLHETCALCHVARLPDGRLWAGAPNGALDVARLRVELDRRWVAAGNPPMMSPLEVAKAALLGPGRTGAESSRHPRVVPADFPPYFALGARTHLNYMGTGQDVRTEAAFAVFAFGAGRPNAETARVPFPGEGPFSALVDFLGALDAPAAPPGDAALIERGAEVFREARCDACHHLDDPARDGVVTLDVAPDGRERLPGEDPAFPRGAIRTSRAHRILQDGDGTDAPASDVGVGDYLALVLERGLAVRRTDGYRAALLRGLWFTAPYLHNGSVPTLEALLEPPESRPVTFRRGEYVVDTRAEGSSNGGHGFGTELPGADRRALVEYLRSL